MAATLQGRCFRKRLEVPKLFRPHSSLSPWHGQNLSSFSPPRNVKCPSCRCQNLRPHGSVTHPHRLSSRNSVLATTFEATTLPLHPCWGHTSHHPLESLHSCSPTPKASLQSLKASQANDLHCIHLEPGKPCRSSAPLHSSPRLWSGQVKQRL